MLHFIWNFSLEQFKAIKNYLLTPLSPFGLILCLQEVSLSAPDLPLTIGWVLLFLTSQGLVFSDDTIHTQPNAQFGPYTISPISTESCLSFLHVEVKSSLVSCAQLDAALSLPAVFTPNRSEMSWPHLYISSP